LVDECEQFLGNFLQTVKIEFGDIFAQIKPKKAKIKVFFIELCDEQSITFSGLFSVNHGVLKKNVPRFGKKLLKLKRFFHSFVVFEILKYL